MGFELTWGKPKATGAEPGAAFSPEPPRVNLLPPSARERVSGQKARNGAIALVASAAVLIGGLWANGYVARQGYQETLAAQTARQSELAAEMAVYAPVTNVAAQSNSLTDTVASQTTNEVLHAEVLARFVETVGNVGAIQNISLMSGANATGCTSTDPFNTVPLAACITFSINAQGGRGAASQLITQLSASDIFVDPFIPTVAAGADGTSALNGTVGVSESVYAIQTTTDGTEN